MDVSFSPERGQIMIPAISQAESSPSRRRVVARALIIFGVLAQALTFTTLPVFAPYFHICKGPYGVNPLPCAYVIRTQPLTGWQLLQYGDLTFVAAGFFLMAAPSLAAGSLRSRTLDRMALIAVILWSALAAVLIALDVPAPSMQNAAWYAFLMLVAISSLTLLGALIILVRAPAAAGAVHRR
jgi:hypothetical protein